MHRHSSRARRGSAFCLKLSHSGQTFFGTVVTLPLTFFENARTRRIRRDHADAYLIRNRECGSGKDPANWPPNAPPSSDRSGHVSCCCPCCHIASLSLYLKVMRASRFPLRLSVRYRRLGDRDWRPGKTENISRSGVLFRAEEWVEIDQDVELRVELPVAGSGRECPEVFCRGRVVRTVLPTDSEPWPGAAVMIEHHDIVRPSPGLTSLSSR